MMNKANTEKGFKNILEEYVVDEVGMTDTCIYADMIPDIAERLVNFLPIYSVSNCGLLEVAEELTKYDYEPLMSGHWALMNKGSDMIIHKGQSKEELINYVLSHCC